MEFFVSRVYYGFYSILSFIISIIFMVSFWNDIIYRKKGYELIILIITSFLSIGIYFYLKSNNKKVLIVIDDEKIFIINESKNYYFEDLSFYRLERVFVKASFEYIHIYDNQNNRVFYFNLDELENKEDLLTLIDKKLRKLE